MNYAWGIIARQLCFAYEARKILDPNNVIRAVLSRTSKN